MKGKGCFITGTDTGIGKTRISVGLLRALNAEGHRAAGMKPIATGAASGPGGLRSADAVALREASDPRPALETINPYRFIEPVSPNIAASAAGVSVSIAAIEAAAAELAARSDMLIIEGIGGWRVPIGERLDVSDLARALNVPVLMVVGLRLGCINHACLTAEAIQRDGVKLAGWIGNQIDPNVHSLGQILDTLESWIAAPCLSVVPYLQAADDVNVAAHLKPALPPLLAALFD